MEKAPIKIISYPELPVHDTLWSITTGRDGNIYIGICGEGTGGLSVFIAKYDPVTQQKELLLEVAPVINEPPDNGRATHSKIHYCMIGGSDGKLYCATHCTGAPLNDPIWRPWNCWDDTKRMFSGFHIFTFDPNSMELEDFGVQSINEGSRVMAFAEKRKLLYGITYPRDHMYVFDLVNRKYRDLGRIGDINPQSVWLDKEENFYTVNDHGYIIRYRPDADVIENLGLRLPFLYDIPHLSIYDTVPSPDDPNKIYGVTWEEPFPFPAPMRLFCYEVGDPGKVYDLGTAYSPEKIDEVHHVGGLVFGDDGWLYFASRVTWREPKGVMCLVKLNPQTLEIQELGLLTDEKQRHCRYISKATKDFAGNLYFAEVVGEVGESRIGRIPRVFILESAKPTDFKPRWPLIRSWG